jgi:hypothetical protein
MYEKSHLHVFISLVFLYKIHEKKIWNIDHVYLKGDPKVLVPLRKVAVSPLLQIQKRSNFGILFIEIE